MVQAIMTARTAASAKTQVPELIDMLEAGVHFGHERSKKNPQMDRYIFMLRNRMAIIDLEKTHAALTEAIRFLEGIAADPNKQVLFVGTKRQAREIVRKHAEASHMPYVTTRWLGGTLTNFSTILKSIEKLEELKSFAETPAAEKITKKEKAVRTKEIERLEGVLEGIKGLKKLPAAIIAVGVHDEHLAVREANRVGIPVVGIADTNANPKLVEYPVPANDDAIRSIDLIVGTLARAITPHA
jgi:small subunit ribosomal protein S2